jgi:hypothetical protein
MKSLRILLTITMVIALSAFGIHGASAAGGAAGHCSGTALAAAPAGRAPARPITVWLAGDSTMANPSSRCPVGWGSQFDALFNSDVVVKNRAVGGRSIQTWSRWPPSPAPAVRPPRTGPSSPRRSRPEQPPKRPSSTSSSLYNSLRLCPNNGESGSGPLGAFFCNDHTHFETYGAQRIARLVADDIRRKDLPLATYLR